MPAAARRVALLAAVCAFALGGAGAASAAAAGIGFQDQSYAPLGGSPSGTKPESKLWFNNGSVGVDVQPHGRRPTTSTSSTRADRRLGATPAWRIDDRDGKRAPDALWDAADEQALRGLAASPRATASAATAANSGRLYRFTYDAGHAATNSTRAFPA